MNRLNHHKQLELADKIMQLPFSVILAGLVLLAILLVTILKFLPATVLAASVVFVAIARILVFIWSKK